MYLLNTVVHGHVKLAKVALMTQLVRPPAIHKVRAAAMQLPGYC